MKALVFYGGVGMREHRAADRKAGAGATWFAMSQGRSDKASTNSIMIETQWRCRLILSLPVL